MKRFCKAISAIDHGYEYGVIEQTLDANGNIIPRSDRFIQLGIATSFKKASRALDKQFTKEGDLYQ